MVSRCLFGIFVFGSNSDLVYRFLTDDLFEYLYKRFIARGYKFDEDLTEHAEEENQEINLSIDDAIMQHFSTLISFFVQTSYRNSPIRRITLESNIQVFFDQIGDNNIICTADESFNTIIVLKTINLFKSLIKFHLGALPFTKSKTIEKLIDRISSSLQYYLNNITINQSILFESCEYLHINSLIRKQCLEACVTINQDIQHRLHTLPTVVLLTCKDKIVYLNLSNDQNRPSNSDLFLLLLNNTSRLLREQFKLQQNDATNKMAHVYKTRIDNNTPPVINSARTSTDSIHNLNDRLTNSLPNIPAHESVKTNNMRRVEVVFMKTTNRNLAPFTMYTIKLTDDISALILVEWKTSSICSHLFELIRQLGLYNNQSRSGYNRLTSQVKLVENSPNIRDYFKIKKLSSNILSNILNEIQTISKNLPKTIDPNNEDDEKKYHQIETNLAKITNYSFDTFNHLFFHTDEYFLNDVPVNENIPFESPMIQTLRTKLTSQLGDCLSFIEIKSQRNITISFCNNDFPGLVHFALIDRSRGHIYTPSLYTEDYQHYSTTDGMEHFIEKKILAFELECLSALQRGCTSYTMTDEYFTYNYTLRLQESNGASMRLYKPFIKAQPPGILHFDFYKALAYENYSSLGDQTSVACFELVCVHLRIVPSNTVREQCEQLWPRLMELDE